MHKKEELIKWGRQVLYTESDSVRMAADRLGDSFFNAFKILFESQGKVVLTGLGKSGHIAQKIASTMSSTGTPAFFVHPSEALHGDFGMMSTGDCLLALSLGGETREVMAMVKYARELAIPVIAITGKMQSSLAKLADCVIDGSVVKEADTLGLAPTSSSTVALAIGDALAVVTMRAKGFTREKFANLHPGGSLGRDLAQIQDLMRSVDEIGVLPQNARFEDLIDGMTRFNFGIVAIVDKHGHLMGCISDGDLRRSLRRFGASALEMAVSDIMSVQPKTIELTAKAVEAISAMEKHQITSLFVCSDAGKLLGLVRLHDLISAKII